MTDNVSDRILVNAANEERIVVWLPRGCIVIDNLGATEASSWSVKLHHYDARGRWIQSDHFHDSYERRWLAEPERQLRKLGVPLGDWQEAEQALDLARYVRMRQPLETVASLVAAYGERVVLFAPSAPIYLEPLDPIAASRGRCRDAAVEFEELAKGTPTAANPARVEFSFREAISAATALHGSSHALVSRLEKLGDATDAATLIGRASQAASVAWTAAKESIAEPKSDIGRPNIFVTNVTHSTVGALAAGGSTATGTVEQNTPPVETSTTRETAAATTGTAQIPTGRGLSGGGGGGEGGGDGGDGGGRASASQTEADTIVGYKATATERYLAFVTGALFLVVCAYAGLRSEGFNEANFFFMRLVAAVAAMGFAATVPGFLHVGIDGKGVRIRSGGAFAVFVLIWLFNPPRLIARPEPIAAPQQTTSSSPPSIKTASLMPCALQCADGKCLTQEQLCDCRYDCKNGDRRDEDVTMCRKNTDAQTNSVRITDVHVEQEDDTRLFVTFANETEKKVGDISALELLPTEYVQDVYHKPNINPSPFCNVTVTNVGYSLHVDMNVDGGILRLGPGETRNLVLNVCASEKNRDALFKATLTATHSLGHCVATSAPIEFYVRPRK